MRTMNRKKRVFFGLVRTADPTFCRNPGNSYFFFAFLAGLALAFLAGLLALAADLAVLPADFLAAAFGAAVAVAEELLFFAFPKA